MNVPFFGHGLAATMIAKFMKVHLKPGHAEGFLTAQRVWNRETPRAPGYLGCFCGKCPEEPDAVYMQFFWRSRQDFERWMADDHDRIAALAGSDAHYERIDMRTLDDALPSAFSPPGLPPDTTLEAADVQAWSEAFRASAALRIAVRSGVFNKLAAEPIPAEQLAVDLRLNTDALDHLLLALAAMGLVSHGPNGWCNTGLADRTLVEGGPAYQGDMVLHNTQPAYLERAFAFGEMLGLPPDVPGTDDAHARFVRAMAATAAAGQADALLSVVDLAGCRTLLDVGGATGPYAVALCRAYPELHAVILDQPETLPLAAPILEQAGLGDRLRIEAHDYLAGPFPGPVAAVLISNVLRGETPEMIDDILRRVHQALVPGGRVLIPDLYVEEPPARPNLGAALFGLHLRGGANYSMQRMARAVEAAGFDRLRAERFPQSVVMNGIIEAHRPR